MTTEFQIATDTERIDVLMKDVREIKELVNKMIDREFRMKWIASESVPKLLGISSRTWQSWRDQRVIPFSQIGAKIYVNVDDLNNLIEKYRKESENHDTER